MADMLEAIVDPDTTVTLRRSPIPVPGPEEVLVRVVVSGSNPKDYKRPIWSNNSANTGDDMAGTIVSAGAAVSHLFRPGTRVAAFHSIGTPYGTYAEYAIAPADMVFALPDKISFEEGATIPLAAMTAAVALFMRLGVPTPGDFGRAKKEAQAGRATTENPAREPLLIYGAASAVGAYAIKLAKAAGAGPIIGVAGRGIPFVEELLDTSAGDVIIDYRDGDEAVVAALEKALGGPRKLQRAFDCVTGNGSYTNIGRVLAPGASLATVLPAKLQPEGRFAGVADDVLVGETLVFEVAEKYTDFGATWTKLFEKGLRQGWLTPHPYEVIPGGLEGVAKGLQNLKAGKASAQKFVFRIAETPGLAS